MKDLLYLKDEQIKDFIQLLFYAYRETFSDPKEILKKKYFGLAHLRSLNLIESNPGLFRVIAIVGGLLIGYIIYILRI